MLNEFKIFLVDIRTGVNSEDEVRLDKKQFNLTY